MSDNQVSKCPNCGYNIDSFTLKCPSCGCEFKNSDLSKSLDTFQQELKEIEMKSAKSTKDKKDTVDTLYRQLASRISNYVVPNNKEDIFEFMILAVSNIDTMLFKPIGGYSVEESQGKRLVSNAWDSKYMQVYQKALMLFPDDARLSNIEKLYEKKKKQIKNYNFTRAAIGIGSIIFMFSISAILFLSIGSDERKLDKKLEQTVVEIQNDIDNGEYDDALYKANTLHYDPDISEEKAEEWDAQREMFIEMINEKKVEQ